jgi:hypothetical protein
MAHCSFRPNGTALWIGNSGVRKELSRVVAATLLEAGDTFTLPARGNFQIRQTDEGLREVHIGKSQSGIRPPMRFTKRDLE